MSHTYTPTAVKMTTFALRDDGDDDDASSTNVPDEAIADGVKYIHDRIFGVTVTRRVQIDPIGFESRAARSNSQFDGLDPLTSTEAQFLLGGMQVQLVETGGASTYHFAVPLDQWLINGATLATATLHFRPSPGHSALPSQPSLAIVRTAIGGLNLPSTTLLSSPASGHAILSAASVVAYETSQALTFTADQNNTIDLATYNYVAIINDEYGANALAGAEYQRLDIVMTGCPDARSA